MPSYAIICHPITGPGAESWALVSWWNGACNKAGAGGRPGWSSHFGVEAMNGEKMMEVMKFVISDSRFISIDAYSGFTFWRLVDIDA